MREMKSFNETNNKKKVNKETGLLAILHLFKFIMKVLSKFQRKNHLHLCQQPRNNFQSEVNDFFDFNQCHSIKSCFMFSIFFRMKYKH